MEVVKVDLVGCLFASHENFCKVVFVNLRVGEDQNSCIKGKKSDTESGEPLSQLTSNNSVLCQLEGAHWRVR